MSWTLILKRFVHPKGDDSAWEKIFADNISLNNFLEELEIEVKKERQDSTTWNKNTQAALVWLDRANVTDLAGAIVLDMDGTTDDLNEIKPIVKRGIKEAKALLQPFVRQNENLTNATIKLVTSYLKTFLKDKDVKH